MRELREHALSNKTAVTQLLDIIKGVAEYSEDNPFINQILKSEKKLLEIEKQQIKNAFNQGYRDAEMDLGKIADDDVADYENAENYYNETYGGKNE